MPLSVVDILFRAKGAGRVKKEINGIKTQAISAGRAMTSMIGGIAGLGAGFAIAGMAKKTMEFDKGLTQLSIQGHITAEQQAVLRERILKTAASTGLARDEILGFTKGITDASGNIQLAADTMDVVAKAAQVTGANANGLGTIVSDLGTKFNIAGEDMGEALEILIEQGEKGRLTLEELARVAPTLFSSKELAQIAGGADGIRELGAVAQVMRQGFGSAEETVTGLVTTFSVLTSSDTANKLKKLGKGVDVRDASGKLRKAGDVFLDVLEQSGGDVGMLTEIFGRRAIRGVLPFVKIFNEAGGDIEAVRDELDKYRKVSGKASTLQDKFNRINETAAVKVAKFKEEMTSLIAETLLTKDNMEALTEGLASLAVGITAVIGGIQTASEALAELILKISGKKFQGGTAADSANLTPAEFEALQKIGAVQLRAEKPGSVSQGTDPLLLETFKSSKFYNPKGGDATKQLQYVTQNEFVKENLVAALAKAIEAGAKKGIENASIPAPGGGGAKTGKGLKPAGGASTSP